MKPWWFSRTLWLNTLLAIGTVVEANLGLVRELAGPVGYLAMLAIAAGGNFVLRFLTTQPIGKEEDGS